VKFEAIVPHIEDLLAKAGADYLDVRIQQTESSRISFRGPNLEDLDESLDFGGAVRALVGGAWGFCSFNCLDELEVKMKQAVKLARLASQRTESASRLAAVPVVRESARPNIKRDPRLMDLAGKVNLFGDYNRQILDHSEHIGSSRVVYFDRYIHLLFMNSEGTRVDQEKMDLGGMLGAVAVRGGDTQTAFLTFGSSNDFGVALDLEEKLVEKCDLALDLLDAPTIQGGEYTVVCDPLMAGLFAHEAFGHLSEADDLMHNERMKEIMTLGRRFGRDILSIYDTGLEQGARGYVPFDDEGVRGKKVYLIKEGVLVGRLHSRESAVTMNEEPTGSARALDYRFPPICRMRATCIEPGSSTMEDLFSGIKRGVYVKSPMGGQTDDEMFTFASTEAYLIEDGRVGRLVRDVNLTGNVFDTLARIDAIGSDFTPADGPGGCGKGGQSPLPTSGWAPHVRITKAVVGGRS